MDEDDTTVLWRPTGPEELEPVRQSGWRAWPPRLPGQPIFYPVLSEEYAIKIARDWNVPASGAVQHRHGNTAPMPLGPPLRPSMGSHRHGRGDL